MRIALVVGSVLLAAAVDACGGSGASSSQAAAAGATGSATPTVPAATGSTVSPPATTPGSTAAASEVAVTSPTPFRLTSPAFGDGADIPKRHTCDGANVSPRLDWLGAPSATRSLVLVVRDPDARGFVHWLAYDVEGAPDGSLPEAIPPTAASPKQGRNDFGDVGYGGPCPPSGTHHYVFTLSALDAPLGLGGGGRLGDVETAMKGHVLAETQLTGTYRRS
jgi:Raf kinase inhibitor-like YbhB/YbcL family protein